MSKVTQTAQAIADRINETGKVNVVASDHGIDDRADITRTDEPFSFCWITVKTLNNGKISVLTKSDNQEYVKTKTFYEPKPLTIATIANSYVRAVEDERKRWKAAAQGDAKKAKANAAIRELLQSSVPAFAPGLAKTKGIGNWDRAQWELKPDPSGKEVQLTVTITARTDQEEAKRNIGSLIKQIYVGFK